MDSRILSVAATVSLLAFASPASAHDIYTDVHGRDGQLCCGNNDCSPTKWRVVEGNYEFLTREGHWISVPEDRITFLPLPGDEASGDTHRAHLCYTEPPVGPSQSPDRLMHGDGQTILFYCAWIPPGAI